MSIQEVSGVMRENFRLIDLLMVESEDMTYTTYKSMLVDNWEFTPIDQSK